MVREEAAQKGIQSVRQGIFVNLFLAIVKAIVGLVGHSFALVADAIESGADVLSSLIVLLGLRTAAKAPDEDHPYGHGRVEAVTAIVVAGTLIIAACIIALEAVRNIFTPHELPKHYTLIVLVIVVVIKEIISRRMSHVAEHINSSAVKVDAWHHRADAITASLAAVGISIAIIGGKGYESADDWAALLASFIIVYNAYHIFKPALEEMMDKAPPVDDIEEIRKLARQVPGVLDVEKCFMRKSGFEYFIDIHVIVDGNANVKEGHRIGHAVKDFIMSHKPMVYDVLTHIEPN